MAEQNDVCRHVVSDAFYHISKITLLRSRCQSICRYFGEAVDPSNPEVLKVYCDQMCDVRSA